MKISQSKVRVQPINPTPRASDNVKTGAALKANVPKSAPMKPVSPPAKKTLSSKTRAEDVLSYNDTSAALRRVLTSAQEELALIRRMKAETARYQQKTAVKARSDAHQLVLNARLTTHREIEELIRQSSEEIQKVLADIRVIRITAQEELAAQRRFTDAVKLAGLSFSLQDALHKPAEQDKENKVEPIKT